jgi:hypothetical protein
MKKRDYTHAKMDHMLKTGEIVMVMTMIMEIMTTITVMEIGKEAVTNMTTIVMKVKDVRGQI